jgi:hypothetical protein
MIRQSRAIKAMASAWGGSGDNSEEPSYSQRLREKSGDTSSERTYLKPWMVDPSHGGEVTPAYGENEVSSLPINLGYSIISQEH